MTGTSSAAMDVLPPAPWKVDSPAPTGQAIAAPSATRYAATGCYLCWHATMGTKPMATDVTRAVRLSWGTFALAAPPRPFPSARRSAGTASFSSRPVMITMPSMEMAATIIVRSRGAGPAQEVQTILAQSAPKSVVTGSSSFWVVMTATLLVATVVILAAL